jgi:hypothetical protein
MSGWTTVEAHSLDGEFSKSGSDYLEEKLQSITQNIIYKSPKRIVGNLGGYGMYPDSDEIKKISKYDGVGIAVCQANDTSDMGETELFIDGKRVEHFTDDHVCSNAISTLKNQYGIYLYANYYWSFIECKVVDTSDNSFADEGRGKLSAQKSYRKDTEILIEKEIAGEDKIVEAHIDNQDAVKLLEKLENYLDD